MINWIGLENAKDNANMLRGSERESQNFWRNNHRQSRQMVIDEEVVSSPQVLSILSQSRRGRWESTWWLKFYSRFI